MGKDTESDAKLVPLDGVENYTMGIPIYIASSDGSLPKDVSAHSMFYVLTGNGPMLVRNGPIFSSISKVDDFIGLGEVTESLTYRFTPIPEKIVKEVIAFFDWASPDEAMVLPYYNTETKEWVVLVPDQEVSPGSIDYEMKDPVPEGFVRLGSWHSHGVGSASHSSIDTHDEETDDGVHITFGSFSNVHKDGKISSSVSLMCDGARWFMDSAKAFDLEDALLEVTEKPLKVSGAGSTKTYEPATKTERLAYKKEDMEKFTFPEEWKAKVKKVVIKTTKAYSGGWSGGATIYDSDYYTPGSGKKKERARPNSLSLCPGVGGCSSCGSALSAFSMMNVQMGTSNMTSSKHDYTTLEGRTAAFADVIESMRGKSTWSEFTPNFTSKDAAAIANTMDHLERVLEEKGQKSSDYPSYKDGDPAYICGEPKSIMFGRLVHGSFFCLTLRPKSMSPGWKNRTKDGYMDWSRVEEYQEYVNSEGSSHYSQLDLDYMTCSDCVEYDWKKGCMKEGSTYYGLTDSPTGCTKVEEEVSNYPTCIFFRTGWESYGSGKDTLSDNDGLCGSCVYLEPFACGGPMCLSTGMRVDIKTDYCNQYSIHPIYTEEEESAEEPELLVGDGSVVSKDLKCYDCEQRIIVGGQDMCVVYNDRMLKEQKHCGFYTKVRSGDTVRESER